ncbi:peptidyl-prolyl cis-trans isomerase [Salipaludibacillus sp. LMS25]|jgi:hypothetical protein|uniref:peptidyl-prolyl cis-trans isomerase n=1 Tax=Salipaludibacillus sp. LMS25 TaxID=2924031 RepID=UPI0020D15ADF|nr:peptidyl-prolyl cis-trans isomerase [Salipaludibacillus sp. LMS25]UTR15225.1 peptidyl-prolyl cis-trans isomerase [Salipaludibacillus sp. LMS25]
MSSMIVSIKGAVKHTIIIDPGVWIFDERKVNLNTYFTEDHLDASTAYFEQLGRSWDDQRLKGTRPQSNDNKLSVDKKALTTSSYGMPLSPFITHAQPSSKASKVTFSSTTGSTYYICSLNEAENGILGFSHKGQPLEETGPVHFYLNDGSNFLTPVRGIDTITIS